jgi:N-acetyl-anhydromuramyl-L-alanine amidase AmpD
VGQWRRFGSLFQERGWDGIGYHYFIRKKGQIEIGRNLEKKPIAQQGHNQGTIAICLHGLLKEKFTEEQYDSVKLLCKTINSNYSDKIRFRGHCEVSAKSCPVFDYKTVLSLNKEGYME